MCFESECTLALRLLTKYDIMGWHLEVVEVDEGDGLVFDDESL